MIKDVSVLSEANKQREKEKEKEKSHTIISTKTNKYDKHDTNKSITTHVDQK